MPACTWLPSGKSMREVNSSTPVTTTTPLLVATLVPRAGLLRDYRAELVFGQAERRGGEGLRVVDDHEVRIGRGCQSGRGRHEQRPGGQSQRDETHGSFATRGEKHFALHSLSAVWASRRPVGIQDPIRGSRGAMG